MNYASVVIVGFLLFVLLFWKFKGQYDFHLTEEDESGSSNDENVSTEEVYALETK